MRAIILRAGGTNCDAETRDALVELGVGAEVVHVNRLLRGYVRLEDYQALVIPGGFSYGDRVRSGAILGKILRYTLGRELDRFVDEGKPVLGICNGFQALLEAELLPGNGYTLALGRNSSGRFEDRWCYLKSSKRIFSGSIPELCRIPVANGEGRLILPIGKEERVYEELLENNQIAFLYAKSNGELAELEYPWNPSGSYGDIAGITNPQGNVLGMMPHPERAFYRYMYPDWTRLGEPEKPGDGYFVFKAFVEYMKKI